MTEEDRKAEIERLYWWVDHHSKARRYEAALRTLEKIKELRAGAEADPTPG